MSIHANHTETTTESSVHLQAEELANGCGQGLSMTALLPDQSPFCPILAARIHRDHFGGHLRVNWASIRSTATSRSLTGDCVGGAQHG